MRDGFGRPATGVSARHEGFQRAVRRAVDAELAASGRGAGRGGRRAWLAALPAVAWFYGSVVAMLLVPTAAAPLVLASVSAGFAMAATLTVVQHDALHHAIARRRWVNSLAAQVAAPVGVCRHWWAAKHSAGHHAHTNVAGLDPDLDKGGLLRLSTEQPWRTWHRWQHLYVWVLYPFSLLGMQVIDLEFIVTGKVKGTRLEAPGAGRTLRLAADKLVGPAVLVAALLVAHPVVVVAAIWVGTTLVAGAALSVIFAVTHYVEGTVAPGNAKASGPDDWAVSQVLGASNVVIRNGFFRWYCGGLVDHHIEHHLLPRIAHVHHEVVAPAVRATCEDFGLEYHELPGMAAALASHVRHLRALGRAEVAPATAPHVLVAP
jgi:linoleoyl-CoA desaturase